MTEDQIEAARTKVRNMLHAADHGNHIGEMAVLRMAASETLLEALKSLLVAVAYNAPAVNFGGTEDDPNFCFSARVPVQFVDEARAALSLAQPYEAEVGERQP